MPLFSIFIESSNSQPKIGESTAQDIQCGLNQLLYGRFDHVQHIIIIIYKVVISLFFEFIKC